MNITPTREQAKALDELLTWIANRGSAQREYALSGPAGTGKTTLMSVLKEEARRTLVTIYWSAMTGKAARRLSEAVGDARTLHSLLYWPPSERPDELKFVDTRPWAYAMGDVVAVDEASMVSPKLHRDIETWLQDGGRVLYVGDGYQLPPILSRQEEKDYGRDYTIFQDVPSAQLAEVIRNDDDILNVATRIRTEKRLPLESNGAYEFRGETVWTGLEDYLDDPHDHALITWRNQVRMFANAEIRKRLGRKGAPEIGEPVLFCKNGHGVLNGEIESVEAYEDSYRLGRIECQMLQLRDMSGSIPVTMEGYDAYMDGKMPKLDSAEWDDYKRDVQRRKRKLKMETGYWQDVRPLPITWSYCLTAHKAQGSEFRRVTVMLTNKDANNWAMSKATKLPDGTTTPFAMRWVYTALTRARKRATIIVGPG